MLKRLEKTKHTVQSDEALCPSGHLTLGSGLAAQFEFGNILHRGSATSQV
jgi:hypothetical protein